MVIRSKGARASKRASNNNRDECQANSPSRQVRDPVREHKEPATIMVLHTSLGVMLY